MCWFFLCVNHVNWSRDPSCFWLIRILVHDSLAFGEMVLFVVFCRCFKQSRSFCYLNLCTFIAVFYRVFVVIIIIIIVLMNMNINMNMIEGFGPAFICKLASILWSGETEPSRAEPRAAKRTFTCSFLSVCSIDLFLCILSIN